MQTDHAVRILRAADPARALSPTPDHQLLALVNHISAGSRQPRSAWGWLHRRPVMLILAALCLLGVAQAVAELRGMTALSLFETNPVTVGSQGIPLMQQNVIPSTVREVATITIPGLGSAQVWTGRARQGGLCLALRLPDGKWPGQNSPLDGGGTPPGCFPTPQQQNDLPGPPTNNITGFITWEQDIVPKQQITLQNPTGPAWRVDYGKVSGDHPAVRVVDLYSHRSVPVSHGGFFAIPIYDPNPSTDDVLGSIHLVAYDAAGRVIADDHHTRN